MSPPGGIKDDQVSADTSNFTKEINDMDSDQLKERIHALETAVATQTASTAGMEATNAATTAGLQAAQAAAQVGTWAVMASGGVSMVVGIFLGLAIAKAKG